MPDGHTTTASAPQTPPGAPGSGAPARTGRAGGGRAADVARRQAPWGALVVIAGLVAIVAVSITAILHYDAASDVATATVGVSGVIAALVGAYFGVRGSSLAQASMSNPHDGGTT